MTLSAIPAALANAQDWLVQTLRAMGFDLAVTASMTDEGPLLHIVEHPDSAVLIGSRGQTLDAFQVLANTMFPMDEGERIRVDCGDYRARQLARLVEQVAAAAQEALERQEGVCLPPMHAADRKKVHDLAKEHAGVGTLSVGEEPARAVVISPLDADGRPMPYTGPLPQLPQRGRGGRDGRGGPGGRDRDRGRRGGGRDRG
ncbi:MAG: R3H domain-containing nucleic acid-binding protein [Candidatus Sericytochromatia bacterium]|nr:R3H domain-containing nucleic acid-binding protein [Candidatus Sericytochromatia bacterium]